MDYKRIAAKWWSDKLRNITPKHFFNGDESRNGNLERALATVICNKHEIPSSNIEIFEENLAVAIEKAVKEQGYIVIGVDWIPNLLLTHLAEEAGINLYFFPLQTAMIVREDTIEVKEGFNQVFKVIFSEEK